jgi:molecular chaperone GrpE
MTGENGVMDDATKELLLNRLRAYLDGLDAADAPALDAAGDGADDETSDLYSVFVEIAGLRNESRAQARLVKDALDQFRAVFETLQSSNAALDRELKEARAGAREQARALLRPLLLDMLDVRDRLAAGLAASAAGPAPRRWAFWRRETTAADPWREGMEMTLRRLDRVLADRRVTPIIVIGRPFTPAVARAVATRDDPSVAEGWVVAETRAGFEWEGELLRAAEVVVAKRAEASDRSGRGDVG